MTSRSSIHPHHQGNRLNIICFPYAGGSPSIFQNWGRYLGEEYNVIAATLPGRSTRISQKPFSSWSELLVDAREQLNSLLSSPHILFGHSFGGRVAYELLQDMHQRKQKTTKCLIISGCRSPQYKQNLPIMHLLSDSEFFETIKTMNGTPKVVLENPELMRLMLPTIRADMMLSENWTDFHGSKVQTPIDVILGRDDQIESSKSVIGWENFTRSTFNINEIDGGHFNIDESPQSFTAVIRRIVEKTHARASI